MPPKVNNMARKMQEIEEKTERDIRKLQELQNRLAARLESLEIGHKRGMIVGDESDTKEEDGDFEDVDEELDAKNKEWKGS